MIGKSIEIKIEQLTEIQKISKDLKNGFKKTETIPWTASSFSSELSFQVTHVICSILNQKGLGLCIQPLEGVDKGIRDEIADVLFNIMNMMNYLNLSVSEVISGEVVSECSDLLEISDTNIHVMNLSIQAGNLWDATFRGDGYKHGVLSDEQNSLYIKKSLAGVLVNLLILSKILGVDVSASFYEMFEDASLFLINFKK